MDQSIQKLVTPVSLAVDALLVVAFFTCMFALLREHVPSDDPAYITFWAGAGSACISGVFWLALQMFRVVYRAQKAAKRTRDRP